MDKIMSSIRSAVRPFVTVSLTATLCYLVIIGKIETQYFIGITSTVIAFWFSERGRKKEKKEEQ